jgi:hypothetical protein
MSVVYIYVLCEPDRKRTPRYVGKTVNPERRLNQQMGYARNEPNTVNPLKLWLRRLISEDKEPVMFIVETASSDNWQDRERYWIERLGKNSILLNVMDGGHHCKPRLNYDIKTFTWDLSEYKGIVG